MNEKISVDLVNSIAVDSFGSIACELGEVALDAAFEAGAFRDIPVFGTLSAFYKAGIEIRQQIFIRKIVNFLQELSNTSLEKRQRFIEDIERNPKQKQDFGETLLLLIERADHLQKPKILGCLLKHHILDDISYEDVMRLSFIVDRVYISDLNHLFISKPDIPKNPNIAASLASVGLLKIKGMDGGNFNEPSSGGILYELNEYGEMLLQYGLDTLVI